jgi:hypothetical protein
VGGEKMPAGVYREQDDPGEMYIYVEHNVNEHNRGSQMDWRGAKIALKPGGEERKEERMNEGAAH